MASPTMNKRQRERDQKEKKKEKEAKKRERQQNKSPRVAVDGEDPDVAGIVPGPQPLPDPWVDG